MCTNEVSHTHKRPDCFDISGWLSILNCLEFVLPRFDSFHCKSESLVWCFFLLKSTFSDWFSIDSCVILIKLCQGPPNVSPEYGCTPKGHQCKNYVPNSLEDCYWPLPAIVKAVRFWESSTSFIHQHLDHVLRKLYSCFVISFNKYLSMWEFRFNSLKSLKIETIEALALFFRDTKY